MASPFKSLFRSAGRAKPEDKACLLLNSAEELDAAVQSREKLMVMFYASWCPFSQAFLKIYREHAAAGDPCYARIVVDDYDPLVHKYDIQVYPTVLFFEKGQLVNRLDGGYHRGLTQKQLEDFARRCAVK